MSSHTKSMRDLMARSFSRYVRVLPSGLEVASGEVLPSISAEILSFQHARTLYQNRKPACRSLDGIQSLTGGRACSSCLLRKSCTPQICLDFLHDGMPLRLMLAYTSARNFLAFLVEQRNKKRPMEGESVVIAVRDRGRWGEVCFLAEPRQEDSSH